MTASIAPGLFALLAFGFDSVIEALSASCSCGSPRRRGSYDHERHRRALRMIAVTYFVLAAHARVEAGRDLFVDDLVHESTTVRTSKLSQR